MHSPLEIAKNYIEIGMGKVHLSIFKMFVLGILAGLFISFSGVGATMASSIVADPGVGRILSACIFPTGLIMVLIAGGELCTGNNLIIICALEKKVTVLEMLKNWAVVFAGNLVGTGIIAFLVVYGHTPSYMDGHLAQSMVNIAVTKVELPFMDAFIRGILCNILVCIAVWMSYAAKKVEGKMMIAYIPILIFVLCGFEHCVADMYFIISGIWAASEYGILAPSLNWGSFITANLIPVTLGNIVGGAGIVGVTVWSIYLKRTPGTHSSIEQEQEIIEHAEEY